MLSFNTEESQVCFVFDLTHCSEGGATTSCPLDHYVILFFLCVKSVCPLTSHLVIAGDVDHLVGRGSEHAGLPDGGELLRAHQAEQGPFGHVHHDAASLRRRVGGEKNLSPEAAEGTGTGGRAGRTSRPVLQRLGRDQTQSDSFQALIQWIDLKYRGREEKHTGTSFIKFMISPSRLQRSWVRWWNLIPNRSGPVCTKPLTVSFFGLKSFKIQSVT